MSSDKPHLSSIVQQGWQKLLRLTSLYINTSIHLTVTSTSRHIKFPEDTPDYCKIQWPDDSTFGYLTIERAIESHDIRPLTALKEMIESDLTTISEDSIHSIPSSGDSAQGLKKMLQTSLEANNEGVLLLNTAGEIIHFNSQLIKMWNLEPLVKKNASAAELSDFTKSQLINSSLTIKGYSEKPERFSKNKKTDTLYLKDGRTIERTSLPVIEKEQTIGRVFSYRDITPETQTRQELREKTNILDTIFDQAPIIMMLVDERARIEKVNKPGIQHSHFAPDSELVGKLVGDILHCVNAYPNVCGTSPNCGHCAIRQTLNRTIQSGTGEHKVEGTMQIKHGNANITRHVLISSATIQTSGERKYLLSIDDITERYMAEKSLMESENRFRNLFEYTPIAYQSLDECGCFLSINQEWSKLTGYSREDIIEQPFGKIFSYETKESFPRLFQKFATEGYINDLELTLERKDGQSITVLVTGRVQYDRQGNYLRSHCILLNFTERKQIQKELIQSKEKAEEATRIKSAFLANMSHEIRTPMNAILGYAEILSQSITDPTHRDYLSSMQSSGKVLMNLINDVLDFSKIDAGKMDLKETPVDIRLLMKEIVDTFRLKASQKGVRMLSEISESTPRILLLDELRLRQIMLNLISNALKFTDEGHIRIEVSTTNQSETSSSILLRVEDTGIGIADKEQEKIFEAFEQIDNQDSKIYGGTGLGLAITHRLVKLMGGEIRLESKLNQGSAFYVTLPDIAVVKDADDTDYQQKSHIDNQLLAGSCVLIVDDNRANRKVTRGFFGGSQVKISEAENGAHALEIMRRLKPQLIIVDLRMPGMSGFETARSIKSNPQWQDIPLIAYTASELTAEEKEQYPNLFKALLKKPIERKKFLQTVANCLPPVNEKNNHRLQHGNESASVISGENEHELLQKWNSMQRIRPRKMMKEFIEEISANTEIIHHPEIKSYLQELDHAFHTFNIEKEETLFRAFPEIIEKLKTEKP
ncbi:PAS domain-containing hybrid sensor histidine kinase/response regulator [Prolixibacter denitrificans]|uniref:histidine kinase n=1 Tax=Prolixibacter denitrificans TaxID=1541063 RepID=A0A2P8C7F0_9BACT|nr:PAS domain-containing hybrid sensor histidine kinase/response regulator [Prolixibacter denitrificans]PSK80894.1 PAS domain S-box-containing protein [Prolixibacter denitrificans]GET22298.1 hypothetical protein JCM18694_25440 [Prolixibacter denitrificans]